MTAVSGARVGRPAHGTPYQQRKRRELLYARGLRAMVDSGPAAEHLRGLIAEGATIAGLARAARYDRGLVRCLVNGGLPRINRRTEARILRLRWGKALTSVRQISAVGTRRRLQGMVAMGHPVPLLIVECGLAKSTINNHLAGRLATASPETAGRVKAAARRLIVTPGTDTEARLRALKERWVPLAAWDDIDDPDERPKKVKNQSHWRRWAVVDDTAELVRLGVPREDIIERLGLTWSAIQQAHSRCGVPMPERWRHVV